jgi:ABC-2 type transport system permease protein
MTAASLARRRASWRLYARLARAGFMSYLASPTTVLLILLIFILQASVFGALWRTVLLGQPSATGFRVSEMLTYVTLAWGLRSYYNNFLDRELGDRIRRGTIVSDLAMPVDIALSKIAVIHGRAGMRLLTTTLPFALVMAALFPLVAPASPVHASLALLSATASLAIMCGFNLLVGTTAFATEHYSGLCTAKGFLINVLSGIYIPYAMLPDSARSVLQWLPFRSLADLPASLYLGKLTAGAGLAQVALQWTWAIGLILLGRRYWDWMSRRHPVDGG